MTSSPSHNHHDLSLVSGFSRALERRLLAVFFAVALVCGTVGFLQYQEASHEFHAGSSVAAFLNALYHTAQLFILHTPLFATPIPGTLEVARWLAALTTLMAAASVGRRVFREELTELKVRRAKHHVVVCGLGRKGMAQVRYLHGLERRVVAIDTFPDGESVEACRRMGVPVVTGDATHASTLAAAGVAHASALYALCPDDRTNCEIAAQVSQVSRLDTDGRLACHIHLGDVDLRAALQETLSRLTENGQQVHFQFFDVFEPEVRRLLVHDLPLDHDGVSSDDSRAVHLVILGFGRMGRTLAVRAAQLGCFANHRRLRISVIDRHADERRDALLFRHRRLPDVCDLEFHSLEAMSPAAWRLLEMWCADRGCLTSIAVCFDDDARALELAVQLRPLLDDGRVRIAVRLARERGLAKLLAAVPQQTGALSYIRPFGTEERWGGLSDSASDPNEVFARRVHAEYEKLMRTAAGGTPHHAAPSKDDVVARWLALPEDFRESSRQQAAHMFFKLRAIGCEAVPVSDPRPAVRQFAGDEVEMLSEWEHDRWMTERVVANWTYAPGKKDASRRTNANLVPWADLTPTIQEYDRVFVRLMPRLFAADDKKICRG
jgi:hypothetical protein